MENIHRFIYRREKPLILKVFAIIVAFIAVYRFVYTPIFSMFLGFASMGLLGVFNGIEVDLKERKLRYIKSFGPLTSGSWEPLPDIQYISVFSAKLVGSVSGISGAKITSKMGVIQVNLITENNERIKIFEGKDLDEAFEVAMNTGEALDLDIFDATQREKLWLYKENGYGRNEKEMA